MPRRGNSNRINAIEPLKPTWNQKWWVQVILTILRWTPEIALAILTVTAFVWLTRQDLPPWAAGCVLVTPVTVLLAIPHTRSFLLGWFWVNVTRHRLRVFFHQNGLRNRDQRLPILLWIWPTKVGETAWVALVGGLSLKDVESRQESLGASCWATEGRVSPGKKWSHMIKIEIIRRDPFTKNGPVRNTLVAKGDQELIPAVSGSFTKDRFEELHSSVGIARPKEDTTNTTKLSRVTDFNDKKSDRKPTNRKAATPDPDISGPTIVSAHGEDISDYV